MNKKQKYLKRKRVINIKNSSTIITKASTDGITLIALVVTIIVLIILAGISINLILGDNGIIIKAWETRQTQEIADLKEKIQLEIATKEAEKLENTDGITQAEIEKILAKYGRINKNEEGTIKSLTPTDKDYEIPFEDIYNKIFLPTAIEEPEKSDETAFDRTYGVIEIEFLEGTSYKTTNMPNVPIMGTNMKKVYWEEVEKEDGTVEVKEILEDDEGFDETKWYSYIAQKGSTETGGTSKWANAVTTDDNGNITGYFVWIPRYAYRIVYFDTPEHEDAYRLTGATDGIIGYSDARGFVHPDGKTPSDMEAPVTSIAIGINKLRPHPAFENGSETRYTQGEWNASLEGIWIAKYEMSGTRDALKSLPGVEAFRIINAGDLYLYALDFNKENKSHMMKNSEWGAMAYLTESKYGRNGTAVSKSNSYFTAGESGATVATNPLQSTTGNYYGIYDMVGGTVEFVTGYIASGTSEIGNSFASIDNTYNNKTESTQYATVYDMISTKVTENYDLNINKKFGDAIIETSVDGDGSMSWNLESSCFLGNYYGNNAPFLTRGGDTINGNGGIFFFSNNGIGARYRTMRLTLAVE